MAVFISKSSQRGALLGAHAVLGLYMVGDLGVLPRTFAQREIAVLAAPDVKLVDNEICCYAREKLRRLLGLDYPVFRAVFRKRGKQIVQRVQSIAYAIRRFELHDEQRARELGTEVERDAYEAVEQLPDALKIILGIGKAPEALLVVLLRLCYDIVEYAALALEHGVKNRARDVRGLTDLVYADAAVALVLKQLYGAFCNVLPEP